MKSMVGDMLEQQPEQSKTRAKVVRKMRLRAEQSPDQRSKGERWVKQEACMEEGFDYSTESHAGKPMKLI